MSTTAWRALRRVIGRGAKRGEERTFVNHSVGGKSDNSKSFKPDTIGYRNEQTRLRQISSKPEKVEKRK